MKAKYWKDMNLCINWTFWFRWENLQTNRDEIPLKLTQSQLRAFGFIRPILQIIITSKRKETMKIKQNKLHFFRIKFSGWLFCTKKKQTDLSQKQTIHKNHKYNVIKYISINILQKKHNRKNIELFQQAIRYNGEKNVCKTKISFWA